MRGTPTRRCWQLVLLLLMMTGAAACVDSPQGVVIHQNAVPAAGCVVSAGTTEYRTQGVLDVSALSDCFGAAGTPLAAEYYAYLLVRNEMPATGGDTVAEQNNITITKALVVLGTGGGDLPEVEVPAFKTLAPGEAAPVGVLVIPASTAAALGSGVTPATPQSVTANIRFVYKHGGLEKKTHSIDYPIVICSGCLIKDLGSCDASTLPTTVEDGNPCNISQDDRVDCCRSANNCLICPAVSQ